MKVSQPLFESILSEQLHRRMDDLPALLEPISSQMLDAIQHHARISVIEVLRSGVVGHMSRDEAYAKSRLVTVEVLMDEGSRIVFNASRLYTELYPPNQPSAERRVFVPVARQPGISTRSGIGLPEGYHPPRPRPNANGDSFEYVPVQGVTQGVVFSQPPLENPTYDQIMGQMVSAGAVDIAENVDREILRDLLVYGTGGQDENGNRVDPRTIAVVDRPVMTQDVAEAGGEFIRQQMREQGFMARNTPVNPIPERLRGLSADRVMIDDASHWGTSPLTPLVPLLAQENVMREAQVALQGRLMGAFAVPPEMLRAQGGVSGATEARVRVEEAQRYFEAGLVSREFLMEVLDPSLKKLIPETEVQSIHEPRRKIEP